MERTDDVIFRFAEVLSVEDENAGLRIKVKLDPYDNYNTLDEVPYCFPLLPKFVHINPKVGECVLVILEAQGEHKGNRYFIGPLVSQAYGLTGESFNRAKCLLSESNFLKPYPDPKMNTENDGTLPDREDVALQGRQNADVVLKDRELRLRCGFKKSPLSKKYEEKLAFNRDDLSYIQMKYHKRTDERGKDYNSSINIVADRINLLSHDSRTNFTLNNRKDLITDDEMKKILEEAHPLPYGDELMNFLSKLIEIIQEHTHPFSMDKPIFSQSQKDTLQTDLTSMLSTSIRIN